MALVDFVGVIELTVVFSPAMLGMGRRVRIEMAHAEVRTAARLYCVALIAQSADGARV